MTGDVAWLKTAGLDNQARLRCVQDIVFGGLAVIAMPCMAVDP
jgi:hypothetical protein